jgi:hypothetical protein
MLTRAVSRTCPNISNRNADPFGERFPSVDSGWTNSSLRPCESFAYQGATAVAALPATTPLHFSLQRRRSDERLCQFTVGFTRSELVVFAVADCRLWRYRYFRAKDHDAVGRSYRSRFCLVLRSHTTRPQGPLSRPVCGFGATRQSVREGKLRAEGPPSGAPKPSNLDPPQFEQGPGCLASASGN